MPAFPVPKQRQNYFIISKSCLKQRVFFLLSRSRFIQKEFFSSLFFLYPSQKIGKLFWVSCDHPILQENKLFWHFFRDSKSWRASKLLVHWFKSYGNFAEWVDFAYWWSCIGKGLPCSLHSRLVFMYFHILFLSRVLIFKFKTSDSHPKLLALHLGFPIAVPNCEKGFWVFSFPPTLQEGMFMFPVPNIF